MRLCACLSLAGVVACGSGDDGRGIARADTVPATAVSTARVATQLPTVPALARSAGGADGLSYRAVDVSDAGSVSGTITSTRSLPTDTTITPTHDLGACSKFVDRWFPSRNSGVGNAIVWIGGISAGPANDAPRRATVSLRDCQIEPRVLRVAAGGTILTSSRDAMISRLRFTDVGTTHVRALVSFNDAGQVVPTELAAASPGVVAITDDMHPWVRGYLAVSLHPFVAITDDSGKFAFNRVPPGTYTVHVWHERLGTQSTEITVTAGKDVDGSLTLR